MQHYRKPPIFKAFSFSHMNASLIKNSQTIILISLIISSSLLTSLLAIQVRMTSLPEAARV